MLVSIFGKNAFQPSSWHHDVKVQLGLDLSSGTTVTLKANTPKGTPPTAADMVTAISIMEKRVNGAGFTGAVVQQQGGNIITVSVPGKGSQQVVNLVGTTALLEFRQVLLYAPNTSTTAPAPAASPTPSATPSAKAKGKTKSKAQANPASPSPSASPSPTPSPSSSAGALGAGGAGTGGQSLVTRARHLSASSSPSPSASASSSASSTASPSPSASASASPTPAPTPTTGLSKVADAQGDPSLVSAAVQKQFDAVNCTTNWQKQIYHNRPSLWDDQQAQTVSCEFIPGPGGGWVKLALDKSTVLGTMVTSASASLSSTSSAWQINLNFNGKGANAFGDLTTKMFDKYFANGQPTSVLDDFAVVLDGKTISSPSVNAAITGGSALISGQFTQKQATDLANQLSYGALPLTFVKQSVQSVSPQLGSSQLKAGLIAAGIGLLLVVIYSFLYYRGLGLVSVSSLIIAALLSYLSVVLLSKYSGFSLSLAGVAGLIVAIGITADSFVVYFERLRDEVREGRTLRAAVERGWTRARRTILVSDTVSFLAAALLYYFAIGDVKGFAFTLGLTTIIDIVVVFLFTKPMVTVLARTKFFSSGHKLSGLDPVRLGARNPWRGTKRVVRRPAAGGASATAAGPGRTTPKEA
jgi:preprotein translocase subunit SecD